MPEDISSRLKQELENLPENWIVMLETKAENTLNVNIESIKILTQKGLTAIVLSASRPHSNLIQLYTDNGIDTKKIFILCTVCKSQTSSVKDTDNVIHQESSSALTEISIALSETVKKIKGKSFLFLDSISTMLIHNEPKTLARFVHGILVRMRLNNMSGILMIIEEETEKEIRAELAQLADKIIKM